MDEAQRSSVALCKFHLCQNCNNAIVTIRNDFRCIAATIYHNGICIHITPIYHSGMHFAYCFYVKVAIPIWNDRISPVFDVAERLLVVDVENGAEISRSEAVVAETSIAARSKKVTDLGVNVLICGAISLPLEQMLVSVGVNVIPHICGSAEDVLQAFISGQLTEQAFLMQGCCGQRRRFRGGRRHGQGRFRT